MQDLLSRPRSDSPPGDEPHDWWKQIEPVWNRSPAAVRRSYDGFAGDERAVLRGLAAATKAHLEDSARSDFVLWIDGEKLTDPAGLLPKVPMPSLLAYLEQLDSELSAGEFTLLLANPHLYDPELWRSARRSARAGAAHVGITSGGVDSCLFLGRYTKTPFGVHRGQMSVVTFPLLGTKRFLLWPF